jgi:hypothetical protein
MKNERLAKAEDELNERLLIKDDTTENTNENIILKTTKLNKNDSGFSEIINSSLNIVSTHIGKTTTGFEEINELKRNSIVMSSTTRLPIISSNINDKMKRLTDVESIA